MTGQAATRRGTTNRDARGNTRDRRRRRDYLVARYRADVDLLVVRHLDASTTSAVRADSPLGAAYSALGRVLATIPACRCYRCGKLLHAGATLPDGTVLDGTVTSDRIIPGCEGGTYRRENLRPACGPCNEITGGHLGAERQRVGGGRAVPEPRR